MAKYEINCNSTSGWTATTQTNAYLSSNLSSVLAAFSALSSLPISGGRRTAKVVASYYFEGGQSVNVSNFEYETEIYIPDRVNPTVDQYQQLQLGLSGASDNIFITYTLAKYAGTNSDICSISILHNYSSKYSIDVRDELPATYKLNCKCVNSTLTVSLNGEVVYSGACEASSFTRISATWNHWIYSTFSGTWIQPKLLVNYIYFSDSIFKPLETGKDYVYVIPFPGGTMNFGGKEYKFVDYLERFEKERHLVAGVSRTYEYGGPLVKYGEQTYGFLASGITDPAAEGGFGTYLPDTKRTVLSLADRENFVNFYYIYPALPQVEKPVWVKKVITWKDVPGATAYEVKLFLDTEEQCIDTQLVGPGVQRFDFTYFIDLFMPAGSYHCTVQALAAEVTRKAIVWVDTPGATSYTVNLYNSDGEIVYTDSVAPGVQTYDFTAVIPTLPTGTNYYGVAIPVIPA